MEIKAKVNKKSFNGDFLTRIVKFSKYIESPHTKLSIDEDNNLYYFDGLSRAFLYTKFKPLHIKKKDSKCAFFSDLNQTLVFLRMVEDDEIIFGINEHSFYHKSQSIRFKSMLLDERVVSNNASKNPNIIVNKEFNNLFQLDKSNLVKIKKGISAITTKVGTIKNINNNTFLRIGEDSQYIDIKLSDETFDIDEIKFDLNCLSLFSLRDEIKVSYEKESLILRFDLKDGDTESSYFFNRMLD